MSGHPAEHSGAAPAELTLDLGVPGETPLEPAVPPAADGVRAVDPATPGVAGADARRRLLAAVAVVALAAGGVGGGVGAWLVERRHDATLADDTVRLPAVPAAGRAVSQVSVIAGAVLPSVVTLKVTGGLEEGTGSGFVLDGRGYILTNNHVVAPAATGGTVRVVFQDGHEADGRIVGRDVSYDLAVVKADVGHRPALALADSDAVRVGDPVIAVGAPLGLQGSVTTGIVSARNRPVAAGQAQETSFINALQTDAAINPGNSGGPLLDAYGNVIGVNAAIARIPGATDTTTGGGIGVGFAIPSNQARRTALQLIRTGHAEHPVIGALLDDAPGGQGARVALTGVDGRPVLTPGGPAERAGLQPGDVVTGLDGRAVGSLADLVVAVRAHRPGDVVTLTVRRGGSERTVRVQLAASGS